MSIKIYKKRFIAIQSWKCKPYFQIVMVNKASFWSGVDNQWNCSVRDAGTNIGRKIYITEMTLINTVDLIIFACFNFRECMILKLLTFRSLKFFFFFKSTYIQIIFAMIKKYCFNWNIIYTSFEIKVQINWLIQINCWRQWSTNCNFQDVCLIY